MTQTKTVLFFSFLLISLMLPIWKAPAQVYLYSFQQWDTIFRISQFTVPNSALTTYQDSKQFQFNLTLNSFLAASQIAIPITYENLTFYYQPALTEELDGKDYDFLNETHAISKFETVYRPESVVGSYAVYSNHKNNKYGTGKVLHIYRPLLIDAEKRTSWVDLEITEKQFILKVNSTFLMNATYPVVLDPVFGKTDVGGTSGSISPSYAKAARYLNDQGAGTVTEISLYASGSASIDHETALYDDDGGDPGDPNNLLNSSNEVSCPSTAQWNNFTLSASVTDDTLYHLAWNNEGSHTYYWDTGSDGEGNYKAMTYGSWDNPYGTPGGGWDRLYSIYCNFTLSGASEETHVLYENPMLHDSNSIQKEVEFSFTGSVLLHDAYSALKDLNIRISETILFVTSSVTSKELLIGVGETVLLHSSNSMVKELAVSSIEVIRSGTVYLHDHVVMVKELGFLIVEICETLLLHDSRVVALQTALTLNIVLALAAIAFVIAVAALTLAGSKRG